MVTWPRFASPVPPEWRKYFRTIRDWAQKGIIALPDRPDDPLRPYRDALGKRNAYGRPRKKLISLRVDENLLELAKELARQHDLRYQLVLHLWIEEGLRRAIREGRDDPDRCPYP